MINTDEFYMREALKEARKAFEEDEVPVGCIIVYKDSIIARGYNMCEKLQDPTAHAEMTTLTSACNHLQSKYLNKCTMYTTLEPCIMCAGALCWAQIGKVIYGADDKKQGMSCSKGKILHKQTSVKKNVLEEECGYLLTHFFKKKRKLKLK